MEWVGAEELVQVVEGLGDEAIEQGVLADPGWYKTYSWRSRMSITTKPCKANRNRRMIRQPRAGDQRVSGHSSRPCIQQVHGDQVRIDAIETTHSRHCSMLVKLDPGGVRLSKLNKLRQQLVEEASQWLSFESLLLGLDVVPVFACDHIVPVTTDHRQSFSRILNTSGKLLEDGLLVVVGRVRLKVDIDDVDEARR